MVLAGVAGNICVMFTAHDAHMRDFDLVVPRGCVASNPGAANTATLAQMADILHPFCIPRFAAARRPRRRPLRAWPGITTASCKAMHR